jgi:hypothetical protein
MLTDVTGLQEIDFNDQVCCSDVESLGFNSAALFPFKMSLQNNRLVKMNTAAGSFPKHKLVNQNVLFCNFQKAYTSEAIKPPLLRQSEQINCDFRVTDLLNH